MLFTNEASAKNLFNAEPLFHLLSFNLAYNVFLLMYGHTRQDCLRKLHAAQPVAELPRPAGAFRHGSLGLGTCLPCIKIRF